MMKVGRNQMLSAVSMNHLTKEAPIQTLKIRNVFQILGIFPQPSIIFQIGKIWINFTQLMSCKL